MNQPETSIANRQEIRNYFAHPTHREWDDYVNAAEAVDQAYREQNLMSLANACRRWWQAARGLQNAERHAEAERPVSA